MISALIFALTVRLLILSASKHFSNELVDIEITNRVFLVSACNLPAEVGKCKAHIPSYYYDADTDSCKKFIYGGCGGNANRFPTMEKCEANCKQPMSDPLPPPVGMSNLGIFTTILHLLSQHTLDTMAAT